MLNYLYKDRLNFVLNVFMSSQFEITGVDKPINADSSFAHMDNVNFWSVL